MVARTQHETAQIEQLTLLDFLDDAPAPENTISTLQAHTVYKRCTACKQYHSEHYFIKNTHTCKECKSKRNKAYRDRLKQATPPWITSKMLQQIEQFKQVARDLSTPGGVQYEIDHIDSLNAKDRCGLNVPWNLQIISSTENKQKKNKNGLIGGDYE